MAVISNLRGQLFFYGCTYPSSNLHLLIHEPTHGFLRLPIPCFGVTLRYWWQTLLQTTVLMAGLLNILLLLDLLLHFIWSFFQFFSCGTLSAS